jgi:hypothetical protein
MHQICQIGWNPGVFTFLDPAQNCNWHLLLDIGDLNLRHASVAFQVAIQQGTGDGFIATSKEIDL